MFETWLRVDHECADLCAQESRIKGTDRDPGHRVEAAIVVIRDKVWEATFARQKKLGVIPGEAQLTEWPEEIPAYDDMSAELLRSRWSCCSGGSS